MLNGANLILRAPEEADFPVLVRLRNDVELQMLLMTQPRPNTTARVREWLANLLSDGQNIFFVIESGGQVCGYLQIVRMNFLHGTGELGLCLKSESQGTGLASEALSLAEDYVHDTFNLRKLTLQVLSSNRRAIQFYEKSGFTLVGVYRQHFYQRGAWDDVTLMEKFLVSEPKSRRN